MRNQPFHPTFHDNNRSADSLIDPPITFRFRALTIVFVIAAGIVLSRIAWVQTQLQDRYLEALNTTTTEYELIPARDGRILTEAADVLATDVDQYSVQIHYRWLQNPVDANWLNRQVRRKLSRQERKDPKAVEAYQSKFESARQHMWQQISTTIGLTPLEFSERQSDIQKRVQRIADSVNQRRNADIAAPASSDGWWMNVASAIRNAITTTPQRGSAERMVVREEESWHEVAAGVSLDIAGKIREQDFRFPGVRVVAGNRRVYPQPEFAAHLVGARTAAKDDEVPDGFRRAYSDTWQPRIGRFGVERAYEHQLRSAPGLRRTVRNRKLEIIETEIEQQPVSGRDLVLTVHPDLQRHAERLLAEALLDKPAQLLGTNESSETPDASLPQPIPSGGSIVVMDVHSGRILAAASGPTFSLSLYTGATAEQWAAANSDQRHPFLNRYAQSALPPGSALKPITAAAVVESGAINPDTPFHCQGYLTQPDEHRCLIFRLYGSGHNDVTLPRAIAQSCNVYFFHAAKSAGFRVLRNWSERFGLNRATGIDLPFEVHGNLPGTAVSTSTTERQWERKALGLSIGQSSVTTTPLQIVRAYAAIANGGWLVTPHVVSPDGTARITTDIDDRPRDLTRRKISGLSEATLDRIREGLTATVESPYGTGYKTVRLNSVTIAGKTGTAETSPHKPDHAWFAGYAPANQPRYAFVVVLEHGGSGSRTAGPIAKEVIRKMVECRLVRSQD